jgi:transposase-like protein
MEVRKLWRAVLTNSMVWLIDDLGTVSVCTGVPRTIRKQVAAMKDQHVCF